jgi:uncharacterized protein (TIGR00730 family)
MMSNHNNHTYEKVIGVFGSANTAAGTPDFEDALIVGTVLARAGHAVMTGGYGGTMGAVSKAAAEAGGHVIGVTVGLFKERGIKPNPWLHEEVQLPTLAARLNHLIVTPDAYVILHGGVGTLAEMALAWSLVQVAEVPARPIVLVGTQWREFVPHFQAFSTITDRDVRFLTIVDEAQAVVEALAAWWRNPPHIPPRLGDVEKTPPLGT